MLHVLIWGFRHVGERFFGIHEQAGAILCFGKFQVQSKQIVIDIRIASVIQQYGLGSLIFPNGKVGRAKGHNRIGQPFRILPEPFEASKDRRDRQMEVHPF